MSLTAARIQFAAEFITLVVTAAALALLVLRPPEHSYGSETRRPVLGGRPLVPTLLAVAALVVLGAASFLHGSLLVSGSSVEGLGIARLAAAGVLILTFPYPGGPRAGRTPIGGILLRIGFLSWLVAGVAETASESGYLIDALLVAGSLLISAALLRVAQRSIAVRVAGSGAATLLLVVVVLALALSTVISNSMTQEELNRLSGRANVEMAAMTDDQTVALAAQLAQSSIGQRVEDATLAAFASGQNALAALTIQTELAQFSQEVQMKSLVVHIRSKDFRYSPAPAISYYDPSGTSLILPNGVLAAPGNRANPVLEQVHCNPSGSGSGQTGLFLLVYGPVTQLAMEASLPECSKTGRLLGVVVASRPLTADYLEYLYGLDTSAFPALVTDGRVLASYQADRSVVLAAARRGPQGGGQAEPFQLGNKFVGVGRLNIAGPAGSPPVYLVLTSTSASVTSSREPLFRTLFLVAFGGTIIALGLAVFTGDRITERLRRLTAAAAAVQAGQPGVRAGVPGDDEVAAVGSAFDSMLDSVSAQSAALQAAAADEARLRNRLEAVVGGMTDALVAVDLSGRITDFNRAAVEMTGVEAGRALGAPAEEIVRLTDENGVPVGRRLFRSDDRDHAMVGLLGRPGGDVPVAVSSGALRDPGGEPAGTVLVFRDMRREHEVEKMKTEFLSRVGHELRTPLTGIMGYADILLRRDVAPERARSWHEEILHSARRLLRIVEMLEFFASDGAGRLVLRPEPLDVRALVNGIASSWTGRLPGNLTLGRRMSRTEALVSADRRWLSLAVDELIDNAVKFSPEGGRIAVRVTDRDDWVEISVSDQGMGMTPQQLEVIFGDFVQVDNSDTRRFGGLGLGLAVVRRVVEGHGGTIRGRSAPGRGATFVIQLPAWPEMGPGNGGARPRRGRPGAGPAGRSGQNT